MKKLWGKTEIKKLKCQFSALVAVEMKSIANESTDKSDKSDSIEMKQCS